MRGSLGLAAAVLLALVAMGCGTLPEAVASRLPSVPAPATSAAGPSPRWVVAKVLDGDTVDVTRGNQRVRLRLLGIDAPETAHDGAMAACGGDEATHELVRLLGSQALSWTHDPASLRRNSQGCGSAVPRARR
jgi:endonuclease YncB( thermonuclease family)